MATKPIGTPTDTPMIVGRWLSALVLDSGSVSTVSVDVATSLGVSDAVEIAVAIEPLGDVGVKSSFEGIGIVLLIVTVTIEDSVGSVGDSVMTVVRAEVIGGASAGAELVEVALVVRSSINV